MYKNIPQKGEKLNGVEVVQMQATSVNGRMKIKVNDKNLTGIEFRNKLGLRSTDFDITIEDEYIKIDTRGYGHGVGLSQYGSNEMAKLGYNYEQIIKHYYKGVDINNFNKLEK